MANTSIEAKTLKNEGSVLKASSGVITSNVVIKAPNIPDNLQQKVARIDEFDADIKEIKEDITEVNEDIVS